MAVSNDATRESRARDSSDTRAFSNAPADSPAPPEVIPAPSEPQLIRDMAGVRRALGGVDSKDSLLRANQIQGFFLGGCLGCDGSFGVERRGLGANGAADHRPPRPERVDRAGQPDVRGRGALDRAYGLSLA